MGKLFAIASIDEAKAFLSHEVLRGRLEDISTAALAHCDKGDPLSLSYHIVFCPSPPLPPPPPLTINRLTIGALKVFGGDVDALKVHGCMTVFANVSSNHIFQDMLDRFFDGKPEPLTAKWLSKQKGAK